MASVEQGRLRWPEHAIGTRSTSVATARTARWVSTTPGLHDHFGAVTPGAAAAPKSILGRWSAGAGRRREPTRWRDAEAAAPASERWWRAIGTCLSHRGAHLTLRLTARPKDVSPFTLRTPVTLHGTLASPEVGVEGRRLAGKVLGAVALGAAVNPWAARLPFVDLGVGDDHHRCARRPAGVTERRRLDKAR